MNTGRQVPCPCGSGRKYKHCCYAKDARGSAEASGALSLPPEVRARARSAHLWEADVLAIPGVAPGGEDRRPLLTLVTAGDVTVHYEVWEGTSAEAPELAERLERAVVEAAEAVGQWPKHLLVRHEEVAPELDGRLEDRIEASGCEVFFHAPLPHIDAVARGLLERLAGEPVWPPASLAASWAAWGLPAADVAALFSAYAAFHGAAPWRWLDALPPLVAIWDDGPDEWTVMVTGFMPGSEPGLAIFSDAHDFRAALETDELGEAIGDLSGWMVTVGFLSRDELPASMQREILRAGWEVASPDAYPWLLPMLTPGGGISRDLARRVTSLLHALVELTLEQGALLSDDKQILWWEGHGLDLWRGTANDEWWVDLGDDDDLDECLDDDLDDDDGWDDTEDINFINFGVDDGAPNEDGLLPPAARAILEEMETKAFSSRAEAEAWIAERMAAQNRTPLAELSGISPNQAFELLEGDWEGKGPLRLTEDLTAAELLPGAAFLAGTRPVLSAMVEAGGAEATAAGNLRRAFVAEMVDRMPLTEGYREAIRGRGTSPLNEQDLRPLHIVRVVLELAGLIARRKARFEVTRLGKDLAREERAGALFARLFRTYFRTFNLAYGELGPEAPEMQRTAPLFIWQVGVEARDWIGTTELAERILPEVFRQDAHDPPGHPLGVARFRSRILRPLLDFGLLEQRETPQAAAAPVEKPWEKRWEVRVSPLFDRFLSFRWE